MATGLWELFRSEGKFPKIRNAYDGKEVIARVVSSSTTTTLLTKDAVGALHVAGRRVTI